MIAERRFLETEESFHDELLLFVFLALEQFDKVNAGGFRFSGDGAFHGRQASVDDGIDETRRALRFPLEMDLYFGGVERIETHFDGFAGELGRSFVILVVQQKRAIAAHQAIEAIEEEAAQVGSRWELTDLFDIALPA
jgi:hypothetical protein